MHVLAFLVVVVGVEALLLYVATQEHMSAAEAAMLMAVAFVLLVGPALLINR